ncbi:MAG: UDP-N-acetylglucosamine 2-epimerase (non-hydrolyzing) [Candidatus Aminicenantales bacterium]
MKRMSGTRRKPFRLVTVVGARPQFVKAAVISRAVARGNLAAAGRPVEEIIIHTGQHYDEALSRVFFEQLEIPAPRYHLGVGSGPHGRQTAAMMARLEPVLNHLRPDAVLVHGDTNSTLAGALTAAKLGLPIAHGEAGLRSFNRSMPEEINRIVTDHLAAWLFCPTDASVANLAREGLVEGVSQVGDVMYDAYLWNRAQARGRSRIMDVLGLRSKRFALATIHRPENTDEPEKLRTLFAALARVAAERFPVVLPLHPRTRKAWAGLRPRTVSHPSLFLTTPVSYFDMLVLTGAARVVLTDSGGLQKEAFFAGTPCLTLRRETEWTETVASGRNFLSGVDAERIEADLDRALALPARNIPSLYGNGHAGRRIVRILAGRRKGR